MIQRKIEEIEYLFLIFELGGIFDVEKDGLARQRFGLYQDGIRFSTDVVRRMNGLIST